MLALSVVYRYAPDRDAPKWSWVSVGAVVATLIWLAASAIFAIYTGNFAKYNQTYGTLGAVVVLMLWLFITALCVIVGAELNAELERQTDRDTTTGPDRPMAAATPKRPTRSAPPPSRWPDRATAQVSTRAAIGD